MNNDQLIWNDFRKGERYALSFIYSRNVELLFRYGKKFSKNNELVKDTIQDLFFDLIRTRENLGETDNIRFYLMKAFRRRLTLKKGNEVFLNEKDELGFETVFSVEDEIIYNETVSKKEEMVRKGLQKLTPKQREILYYRYTCEFEYDQICELMSLKYDSARKQVFRALQSLKDNL